MKFNICLAVAEFYTEVEADSPEEALEIAIERAQEDVSLCWSCSNSATEVDCPYPVAVTDESGDGRLAEAEGRR